MHSNYDRLSIVKSSLFQCRFRLSVIKYQLAKIENRLWEKEEDLVSIVDSLLLTEDQLSEIENRLLVFDKHFGKHLATAEIRLVSLDKRLSIIENVLSKTENTVPNQSFYSK